MPAQYAVFVTPLDNALDRIKVLGPGNAYDAVSVVRCPAGADVEMHLGQSGDGIPFAQGDGWIDLCGEEGGIFISVGTASPGDSVSTLVFFEGGGAPADG